KNDEGPSPKHGGSGCRRRGAVQHSEFDLRHSLVILNSTNVAWRVAFSPDSKHLVAASWDRTVRVWDTTTGEPLRNSPAHAYAIFGLALSPNGKSAVTCSADETVKGWDLATGRCTFALPRAHPGRPTCVAFRPDGQLLASASA